MLYELSTDILLLLIIRITCPSAEGSILIIDRYTVIVDVGKSRLSVGDIIQIYSLGEPII